MKIRDIVPVALGQQDADVLLTNATIINVFTGLQERGNIALFRKRIAGIGDYQRGKEVIDLKGKYVVPGLIDAHLHIESSMVSPREFARAVLARGTTTVIADPHEIANVLGTDGLTYIIQSTEGVPLNVYIALPSAVPATNLETAGARLGPEDMVSFVDKYPQRIIALGEVMNFPGVLNTDSELIAKIEILRHKYKKIDGHAPGLTGKQLNAYIAAFIRSDHESISAEEALEKVSRGMQVFIREGTAVKNLKALIPAVNQTNHHFFSFCTDDRDPLDIIEEGHIDFLIKKSISLGLDPILAIRMATINTARHYNLRSMGAIAPGYKADMVVLDNLSDFSIRMVIKDSHVIAEKNRDVAPLTGIYQSLPDTVGKVNLAPYNLNTFAIKARTPKIRTIKMTEGELYTTCQIVDAKIKQGYAIADPERDIAKVLVFDRHEGKNISKVFVQGFGVKRGALATTIGHDAHNLCVLGVDDEDMLLAVQRVEALGGGIVTAVDGAVLAELPLPIAGLMSNSKLGKIVEELTQLKDSIRKLGSHKDILMSLHFIQLAVIPEVKITDQGIVNVLEQSFIDLFV